MASPRLWPSHAPSSPFQSRRCPAPGPPRSLTSGNWARTCVKLLRVSRKFWGWCSYDSQHVHTSTIYLAELRYHIYNQTTCDMCLLVKYDVVKYCNIYIYNIIYVIICIYIYEIEIIDLYGWQVSSSNTSSLTISWFIPAGAGSWVGPWKFHQCMLYINSLFYLSIHPSIHPSIHLCIYPSIHLSIYPSIHPSIYVLYREEERASWT